MKKYILTTLFSLLILTSCSINDDNGNPDSQVISAHWNLIKTTGGIAGINNEFPLETVIWTFDRVNSKLTVENNNTDETKQDALDSGTYDYSVIKNNKKTYFNIAENEFGQFTIIDDQLVIDENEMPKSSGTDGYVYTFKKNYKIIE